jgi:hypothetical protein
MLLCRRHVGEIIERAGDNGVNTYRSLRHYAATAGLKVVPTGETFHASLTPSDKLSDGAFGILLI